MTPLERARFESHMRRCLSCAYEVESRRPVLAMLEADRGAGTDTPAELGARIRAGLREHEQLSRRRVHSMPQAAAAAAAACFLAVGLAIGYVAGRPGPEPPGSRRVVRELPRADEAQLYQALREAQKKLVESGATETAESLKGIGGLLEQLAELKGDNISYVRVAMPVPESHVSTMAVQAKPTTPAELKTAYKREIAARPGSAEAALAQVKLAEIHFDLGEFRQARHAYALFKVLYPEQYQQYARRAEVDDRLQLLAESEKHGYRTLALYRQAGSMKGSRAFNKYADIIRRQPTGQLAQMAVMEMARFEWENGRPTTRMDRKVTSPDARVEALTNLVENTESVDIGALAQVTIGDIYRDELGDVQAAEEAYEIAAELFPATLMASEARDRMNRLVMALAR